MIFSRLFHDFDAMTARNHGSNDRFMLWIDSVGGYWVCLAEEVVLGQPVGGVDVPILGDLSKRHARIRRDGEAYLVEALRPVRVAGQPVDGVATLQDRARILLGDRSSSDSARPHPLSATARLEFSIGTDATSSTRLADGRNLRSGTRAGRATWCAMRGPMSRPVPARRELFCGLRELSDRRARARATAGCWQTRIEGTGFVQLERDLNVAARQAA